MSIISANLVTQSAWQQLQLDRAQVAADQARLTARTLRAQANSAQAAATKAQSEADSLRSKSAQAQSAADQANLLLQLHTSLGQAATQVNTTITNTLPGSAPEQPGISTQTSKTVSDVEGKTVGALINTSA